jgi:hypothetical protein
MTALPDITPRDEHKAKLIANVYPADWLNPKPAVHTIRTRLTDGRVKLFRHTLAWRRR